MTEVEIWVVVDDDGNYAFGCDQDQAREAYEEDFSGLCRRAVCVTLKVPTPKPIEVTGEVPAEPETGCELTVK